MPSGEFAQEPSLRVVGVVTMDEAQRLGNLSSEAITNPDLMDTEARAVYDRLHGAAEGAVAIVVEETEQNELIPRGYMDLGANDYGTKVKQRPDQNGDLHWPEGLPDPETAYAEFLANQPGGTVDEAEDPALAGVIGGEPAEGPPSTAPVTATGPGIIAGDVYIGDAVDVEARRQLVEQELREQWGLPEVAARQDAVRRLDDTRERLQTIISLAGHTSDLAVSMSDLQRRFGQSLDDHLVHFDSQSVDVASEQLDQLLANLRGLQDGGTMMPATERNKFDELARQLQYVRAAFERVIPYGTGGNIMDTDAVEEAANCMRSDPAGHLAETSAALQRLVDEKRIALMGYGAAMEDQVDGDQEQFRDDRIRELAVKLREGGAGEEDVAHAVALMEIYLNQAIEDKASPVHFPSRIVANDSTPRRSGAQVGENGPSRTIAAEMAVDMLRGGFDVEQANKNPIELDFTGKVILGQHRAAALMTLYGKNWIEEAQKVGHVIVRK
jgi:hypothetical protein